MFRTTQIVKHDEPVELPTCMYKVKNIHASKSTRGIETKNQVPSGAGASDSRIFEKNNCGNNNMEAVLGRQEQILKQLAEIKNIMTVIKGELKSAHAPPKVIKCTFDFSSRPREIDVINIPEIIINASPSNPPHSLELIQRLLADSIYLSVKSHLHSSVATLPKGADALVKKLENFIPKNGVPKLSLRLIWKEVGPQMELIVSSTPTLGEVNILRYLARVIPVLNYENTNPFELDPILDTAYGIVQAKSKTERATLLQNVNKKLGKNNWLCGHPNISIADIAVYSAIKQAAENESNVNITNWMSRCEKL